MTTDLIVRRSQDHGIIQRAILRGFNLRAIAAIAAGERTTPMMHPHATALDATPMSVRVDSLSECGTFALVSDPSGEPFAVLFEAA